MVVETRGGVCYRRGSATSVVFAVKAHFSGHWLGLKTRGIERCRAVGGKSSGVEEVDRRSEGGWWKCDEGGGGGGGYEYQRGTDARDKLGPLPVGWICCRAACGTVFGFQ